MNEINEQLEPKKEKKGKGIILALLALVLFLSIGYAILSTTINITGTSTIANTNWDIHFNNIQVTPGSVAIGTGDSAATINPANLTSVAYTITLDKPGDFYEFTVDVVNGGTVDGMIDTVTSKMNGVEISALPNYLDYSVAYSDGKSIAANHLLAAGQTHTYRVRVEYKKNIDSTDLPANDEHLSFQVNVEFVQANEFAVDRLAARYVYRNNENSVDAGANISSLGTIYGTYQQAINNTGKNYFLRHKVEGTEVVETSVGFVLGGNVYYLMGGGVTYDAGTDTYSDSAYFEDNVDILKTAFGVANCEIDPDYIECTKDGITANAALDGGVDAGDTNGNLCDVGPFDSSYCYNA